MNKLRFIAILALLLWVSPSLKGQGISSNTTFKAGEQLTYSGYYNWGFIWVAAGKVNLKVDLVQWEGKPSYRIKGTGKSLKAFDWFFTLRDTLTSFVDTTTLAPLYFDRQTHEAKYIARHRYQFDYPKGKIYSKIKKRSKPEKSDTIQIRAQTFDILTVAYYARNLDFSRYTKGDKIPLNMLIDNKIHSLYIRYLGIDTIKTRNKELFECLTFSPLLVEGTMFKGGEDMKVWISNDDNRIPIMVEAKVLIGSVKGILSSYEGLRSSTNSQFKNGRGKVNIKE